MAATAGDAHAAVGRLPPELLSLCFSFLDLEDRCLRAAATCRRWRAAAREPPLSADLALPLALGCNWAALVGRAPSPVPDPAVLAFLRRPACAGLRRLRLSVAVRAETDVDAAHAAVGGVLAAAPAALAALELALDSGDPVALFAAAAVARALAGADLASRFPRLAALRLDDRRSGEPLTLRLADGAIGPHPALEHVRAHLVVERRTSLLTHSPALRAVDALSFDWRTGGADALAPLAARGLACGRLHLSDADLSGPEAAAAAAHLLRPSPFYGPPSELSLYHCTLPDSWPEGAFEGIRTIGLWGCPLRPATLRWIVGGAHVPTLRRICIECPLEDVSPTELVTALRGMPPTLSRIELSHDMSWPREETRGLIAEVQAEPAQAARFNFIWNH